MLIYLIIAFLLCNTLSDIKTIDKCIPVFYNKNDGNSNNNDNRPLYDFFCLFLHNQLFWVYYNLNIKYTKKFM